MKRKYTKPQKINRIYTKVPFEERFVQSFYSVRGKFIKEAEKEIKELIKKWR